MRPALKQSRRDSSFFIVKNSLGEYIVRPLVAGAKSEVRLQSCHIFLRESNPRFTFLEKNCSQPPARAAEKAHKAKETRGEDGGKGMESEGKGMASGGEGMPQGGEGMPQRGEGIYGAGEGRHVALDAWLPDGDGNLAF